MKKYVFITVMLFLFLVACTPEKTVLVTSTPIPTLTAIPEITATPLPLLSVNALTYNILYGAGVNRSRDKDLPLRLRDIDRTPLLMAFLKETNADIVGLQEVVGWQEGSPSFMETFAAELGMNYFLADSQLTDMNVAILTKYEIAETEDYSDQIEAQSYLRAKLITPDGEPLNVFVVHLGSTLIGRSCEVEFLLTKMEPYKQQRTILMGDMNFGAGSPETDLLANAGWIWVTTEPNLARDQIWVSPSMVWTRNQWILPLVDNRKVSDHYPLGSAFDIFSHSGELLPTPIQTTPETKSIPDLPILVTDALKSQTVSQSSSLGSQCSISQWAVYSNEVKVVDDYLKFIGRKDWQTGAMYNAIIPEGKSILLNFLFTPESEFNIFLESGNWADPAYRRFGVYMNGESFWSDMWTGETPLGGDNWNIQPKPDTWYNLLLMADKDAKFTGYLWNPDDPENVAVYHREMEADWGNLPWHMSVGANQGILQIKDVFVIGKENTP